MNKCRVEVNGEVRESEDFVCVVGDEEQGAVLYFHTDPVLLGMAVQMLTVQYRNAMSQLSEEDQKAVLEALGMEVQDE